MSGVRNSQRGASLSLPASLFPLPIHTWLGQLTTVSEWGACGVPAVAGGGGAPNIWGRSDGRAREGEGARVWLLPAPTGGCGRSREREGESAYLW